ncbi:RNA 3'-terminal phosphate cyclase [Natronorubrum daqingense]|uniref:RNA 3'-terminal phosphate cyclase n=1 Tax=Natronorubrum daqingense TaxID=588898 RepID=A0A1N7CKF2_9EURY|nr:RNA 3'-terminal phosphate cyclase [Natronorubrum daqingense]APX96945.1 RNA 3'-terminal-phosphate cyclase [Natronorubrum daqingense]SIR64096.1 RNA 3'-terminal phosphate cyclase (ATP) [Natronorubrum daqingense]
MSPDHELDGSDAGGQFVRSALTLATLRNESIRIESVRGDRPTPGLRHQHLAVLETMAQLCDADISGGELGSETVEFDPGLESTDGATDWQSRGPGSLPGGEYAVDIDTAGSVTLLFDAMLPLAAILESRLTVTATGGTDVKWSPPLEYFRRVKLPFLRRHGLSASCEVERRGFYPDGGGRVTLHVDPSSVEPIDSTERGELEGVRLYSTESESLADRDVAYRQAEGALERLGIGKADSVGNGGPDGRALELLERREEVVDSPSPGSAIVLRLDHTHGVAGFAALGERGKPAERVGEDAADELLRFLERGAESDEPAPPIDRHLADQLLVFLALAGGRLRVPSVTDHVASSRELLAEFGAAVDVERSSVSDDGAGTSDTASALLSVDSPLEG